MPKASNDAYQGRAGENNDDEEGAGECASHLESNVEESAEQWGSHVLAELCERGQGVEREGRGGVGGVSEVATMCVDQSVLRNAAPPRSHRRRTRPVDPFVSMRASVMEGLRNPMPFWVTMLVM